MKDFPGIKFSQKLRTASYMFQLYNILRDKHGKMNDISLYDEMGNRYEDEKKDQLIRDAFGIVGSSSKDKAETIKVLYDFMPCNLHDPILLT